MTVEVQLVAGLKLTQSLGYGCRSGALNLRRLFSSVGSCDDIAGSQHVRSRYTRPKGAQTFRKIPSIDPTNLREALDVVRAVNRTTLIRKVDETGRSTNYTPEEALDLQGIRTKDLRFQHVVPKDRQHAVPESVNAEQKENERKARVRHSLWTANGPPDDYGGKAMPLIGQWSILNQDVSISKCPWLSRIHSAVAKGSASALQRLAQEIHAFESFMAPTPAELKAIEHAVGEIRNMVVSSDNSLRVEVIGSRANGLATALSDIDLNLVSVESERLDKVEDRELARTTLKQLYRNIRRQTSRQYASAVQLTLLLDHARVPIIRGIHRPTGLDFQIQSTTSAYNSTEYIKAYLEEYPTLRALFFIIKQTMMMRGLTDGSAQGLTSYPLLNMIIASLKLQKGGHQNYDVAQQFLAFLDMYAEIDFHTTGIVVSPPQLISKFEAVSRSAGFRSTEKDTSEPDATDEVWSDGTEDQTTTPPSLTRRDVRPYAMYLEDPADPSNNLGRGCGKIKHVQATIIAIREELQAAMLAWNQASGSRPTRGPSLLEVCIGGDYRVQKFDRLALQQHSREQKEDDRFLRSIGEWNI